MKKYLYLSLIGHLLLPMTYADDGQRDPAMEAYGPRVIQETVVEPEKGPVNLEFTYIGDFGRNFSGGHRNGNSILSIGAARAYVDMDALAGLKGNSLFFHIQGTHGNVPSKITKDAQIASNIESYSDTVRFMEMWMKQEFGTDKKFSALFGLLDLNAEFYLTKSSLLFVNSSMGLGTELAQLGLDGRTASTFPVTSLAFLLKYSANEFYFDAAAFDAHPGAMDTNGTRIKHDPKEEGYLVISEAGWATENNKIAVGAWAYTKKSEQVDNPGEKRNRGAYFISDFKISEKFSGFVRYGFATEAVNQFKDNLVAGVVANGLWGRENDKLGFGMTQVTTTKGVRNVQKREGKKADDLERVFELTYQYRYSENVAIQPDFQYIVNPGTNPKLRDALVGFLRVQLDF